MEKTGYRIELLASLNKDWENFQDRENSEVDKKFKAGLSETVQIFKEIRKSRDLDLILDLELLTLEQEKDTFGRLDPSSKPSLENAIQTFASDVKGAVEVVKIPEKYQAAALTHSSRRLYNGVPKDGFHEAINSHITRLGNRIRTVGLSVPEKNLLMARQENMREAKELYIELQRKALGLKEPEKSVSKGMEL